DAGREEAALAREHHGTNGGIPGERSERRLDRGAELEIERVGGCVLEEKQRDRPVPLHAHHPSVGAPFVGSCPETSDLRGSPLASATDPAVRTPRVVETHRSFCRFCHAICGIEVDVEDGRAVAVRGDMRHPISQGYLCVKGRELLAQHADPLRLRESRKRLTDGTWTPLPSDTALDEIAARVSDLIARHGPTALALYSGTHGLFGSA